MSLSHNSKKLFGVALDPSDDPMSLELKRAWMMQAERGGEGISPYLDPYDAVVATMSDILEDHRIEPAGKFPVPSWLHPRPEPSDLPLVTVENFGKFYDSGGMQSLLSRLRQFVKEKILPSLPVMAGIDHSATMSVVQALAEQYSPRNLGVLVLDQHFDAIPLSVRLAETSRTASLSIQGVPVGTSAITLGLKDQCCCGNFWSYLMADGIVLPENIAFIGVADYPGGKPAAWKDSPFRNSYLDFEKRGCRFFPLSEFQGEYGVTLSSFIRENITSTYVYVSLDLDVCSYNGSYAARYMDLPGLSHQQLLDTASIIAGECHQGRFEIAGLDIMEFNMHFLGIDMGDGAKDETLLLVRDFIGALT